MNWNAFFGFEDAVSVVENLFIVLRAHCDMIMNVKF